MEGGTMTCPRCGYTHVYEFINNIATIEGRAQQPSGILYCPSCSNRWAKPNDNYKLYREFKEDKQNEPI